MHLLGRIFLPLVVLVLLSGGSGVRAAERGELVLKNICSACHAPLVGGGYARITEERKTPEGWNMTLTRMETVRNVTLSNEDRAAVIEYLSDHYGLAPSEAAPYRAFLERVPSVPDVAPNKFLGEMCARCHSFARIGLERRDSAEWLKLSNFHLGQYPSTEYSEKGRDREWWKLASTVVPPMLGKMFSFTTPAWTAWQKHRDPDLSGIWRVTGHAPGRGDYQGRMTLEGTTRDHYTISLTLTYADGSEVRGIGRAVIYTGYEWRATFTFGKDEVEQVLALGKDGGMSGRWYETARPERGGTMLVYRETVSARIMQITRSYLRAGETANIEIDGVGLGGTPQLGAGVKVVEIVSHSPDRMVIRATADANAAEGARTVAVGAARAKDIFVVYRRIGFVKVVPGNTIARVGGNGGPLPPVAAQFEAVGYLAPAGGDAAKAVRIGVFPAHWAVSGYDADADRRQDARFSGYISTSGEFEPAGAGPDPKRKFGGNNVGNLKVTATVSDRGRPVSGDTHLIVTVQRWITPPIL